MKKILLLISMLFLSIMFLVGGAYALPISAIGDVSGATDAEDGIADDTNNDLGDLNSGPYWYTDWVNLQKFDWGGGLTTYVDINLTVTPAGTANTGTYYFNPAAWDTYSDMMIVLKDGGLNDPETPPENGKWYWFAYLLGDQTYSGDWTYPEGKDISHLSVYGRIGDDPPGNPVPEPATMLLLGTGLVCLAGMTRKKFKK